MPQRSTSWRSASMAPSRANLLAVYETSPGRPATPDRELTFDDAAAALPAHDRQHRPGQQQRSEQIDFQHLPQRRFGGVLEGADAVDAGIVDQYVEPPVRCHHAGDRAGEGVWLGHVQWSGLDVQGFRLRGRHQRRAPGEIAHGSYHGVAVACERKRRFEAEAATAPGNQYDGHGLLFRSFA